MEYSYVPLPARQPLKWPNGKQRVALILTFNLESWDLTKDTDQAVLRWWTVDPARYTARQYPRFPQLYAGVNMASGLVSGG